MQTRSPSALTIGLSSITHYKNNKSVPLRYAFFALSSIVILLFFRSGLISYSFAIHPVIIRSGLIGYSFAIHPAIIRSGLISYSFAIHPAIIRSGLISYSFAIHPVISFAVYYAIISPVHLNWV